MEKAVGLRRPYYIGGDVGGFARAPFSVAGRQTGCTWGLGGMSDDAKLPPTIRICDLAIVERLAYPQTPSQPRRGDARSWATYVAASYGVTGRRERGQCGGRSDEDPRVHLAVKGTWAA